MEAVRCCDTFHADTRLVSTLFNPVFQKRVVSSVAVEAVTHRALTARGTCKPPRSSCRSESARSGAATPYP
jgi:hypothetical protein